jgi:hypothetical protein
MARFADRNEPVTVDRRCTDAGVRVEDFEVSNAPQMRWVNLLWQRCQCIFESFHRSKKWMMHEILEDDSLPLNG